MKLSKIIIYPIKSLGGIELNQSEVTQRGLKYDRRYMLINENNKFLTIRQHKEFLFFELKLKNDGFTIHHKKSGDSIEIPFELQNGEQEKAVVWEDDVDVIVANSEINSWFSNQLDIKCRLVYLPNQSPRRVQPDWVKEEQHVSLADGYPYLIVGSNSVNDLNSKIDEEISYQRFRPNLIFEGGEAYEEYYWKDIVVGETTFQCIKPCTRCIVITMNPETAEVGKEPLKTLFKQKVNDNMIFGQNAVLLNGKSVKVGDEIRVISKKSDPYEKIVV